MRIESSGLHSYDIIAGLPYSLVLFQTKTMKGAGEKKKKNLKKKKLAYNSDEDEGSGNLGGRNLVGGFKTASARQKELLDLDISNKQYDSDEEYNSELEQVVKEKKIQDTKTQQELVTQKSKKMGSLLQKILETGDDKKPVLSLKRKYEQDLDNQKLEVKAKKLLKLSKREKSDVSRVIPDYSTMVHEKDLKKIATRGGKLHVLTRSCSIV